MWATLFLFLLSGIRAYSNSELPYNRGFYANRINQIIRSLSPLVSHTLHYASCRNPSRISQWRDERVADLPAPTLLQLRPYIPSDVSSYLRRVITEQDQD